MKTPWRWVWAVLALAGLAGCGAMDDARGDEEGMNLEAREQAHDSGSTPGFEYFEDVESVAHDRDGNIVVAGFFDDRLQGGPLALEGEGPGTVLVAKLRPNGERLWARAFPGGGAHVSAVTVDRDRNIVLAGLTATESPSTSQEDRSRAPSS
jgi:hypothetical protein